MDEPSAPELPGKTTKTANTTSVESWLQSFGLERYAQQIREEGYDELEFLRHASEDELYHLAQSMKFPHRRVFRDAFGQLA
eukprot:COSAG04_NODE_23090_length_344_cov_0.718367_1_plen_80_part_01